MVNSLKHNNRFFNNGIIRSSAIALALTAAAIVPGFNKKAEAQIPVVAQGATLEEVAEDTQMYIGQTVTVRGELGEMLDSNTFKLSEKGFLFFGDDEILVVNASGQPFVPPADKGIPIQVTGQVREFRRAELETEFGWDFWDPDVVVEYENKPAIVAQSIALAPEPDDISDDPSQFYGQRIAVTGEISEYRGLNTFVLEDRELFQGDELLVINTGTGQLINAGDPVVVTGQLRPFTMAEIERDFDIDLWDLDLQRELETEFSTRPVFLADEVYRMAE